MAQIIGLLGVWNMAHIKDYHTKVEIFTILCAPRTYIMFKLGYPAYTTFVIMIIAIALAHVVRLIVLKKHYSSFSYREYIFGFVFPALIITVSTILFTSVIRSLFANIYSKALMSLIISSVILIAQVFIKLFFQQEAQASSANSGEGSGVESPRAMR